MASKLNQTGQTEYEQAKERYEEAKEAYQVALKELANANNQAEIALKAMIDAHEVFLVALGKDRTEEA